MEIKPSKYHLKGHNRKEFKKKVQSHMIPTLLMATLTDAESKEVRNEIECYDKAYECQTKPNQKSPKKSKAV